MNITDYTGKAYDFKTYNCWHHVSAVRKDIGVETPRYDVSRPIEIAPAFDGIRSDDNGLTRVSEVRDYDIVLMGVDVGGRVVWHAGVYFAGYVSHCECSARQVRLELFSDIKKNYTRVEFWR